MANSMVNPRKQMKRMESRKSHSWWWDSHISPKNNKWLAENLEEMDQSVKRMLKLIEGEGDSFAKKAEMYYQKRPELISQVEEFYRVYRSLAERYDHVTGELRKSVPADLPSPGSVISDVGSEPGSTCPSPDQRSRLKSRHRAAGFDVFLGSGGSHSDVYNKDGDEMSSSLSSESDSDDSSSINNYSSQPVNAGEPELRKKIGELEVELRDTKTKLRMQEVENSDGSCRGGKNGNLDDLVARIAEYEYELNATTEKLRCSYEENAGLRLKLQNYRSSEFASGSQPEFESLKKEAEVGLDAENGSNIQEKEEILESNEKVMGLKEELKMTKKRLQDSEKEISSLKKDFESKKSESIRPLQEQLELAKRDNAIWKVKLTAEKREVSKLQERILRYKTNLSEREQEIRDLKVAVSDAEQNLSLENKQLKAQISKLIDEKTRLEENLEESNQKTRNLEEEIQRVDLEKTELGKRLTCDIEQLKSDISEKGDHVKDLNKKLDDLISTHEALILEKDELKVKVATLITEIISKDSQIGKMEKHWHQLHVEQAELIAGTEKAHMQVEELRSRVEELEDEVARQKGLIDQGGEEKREAIRQLCYSIEHYRNGYHRLRKAFIGQHKRPAILAR